MDNKITINLEDLEHTIHFLLLGLKENKGVEIEINNDFYWDINSAEIYNPYKNPTTLSLAQLSDDIQEVYKVNQNRAGIGYDLKRIAEILKVLSIEYPLLY